MRSGRKEKGAVLVEMAFMLPILTLIFLMVIDVGLVVREHQLLQNAAREGAHFSALKQNWVSILNPNATIARIQQVVVDYCSRENITINASDVSVNQNSSIPLGGGLTAKGSEVTVTYTRQMLVLGRPLLPSSSMTLTATSVFRNLY
jgi:Flp pilus assembly protein TadG